MQNAEELSPGQISDFLKASYGIEFSGQNRAERYGWTQRVLIAQEYASQGKKQRGQIRSYIGKVSGLSMPQVARLIRMYRANGKVEAKVYRRRQFARKYTAVDVGLLAAVDRAHDRLSGPATAKNWKSDAMGWRISSNGSHTHWPTACVGFPKRHSHSWNVNEPD